MSCERANVQTNVEKARLINRRNVKMLCKEKRWEEKLLYERIAINAEKSITED